MTRSLKEITETYEALRYSAQDQYGISLVVYHIKEAVAPFDPGEIVFMIQEMGFTKQLHITPKNWPDLGTVIDMSNFDLVAFNPEAMMESIGRIAASHFRNIPYIEPDPSFGLGEN